jgi:(S)-2-hydroxyglutarate dehydrogenase
MQYDIIIIGGGIIGLATALKLKEARPELKIALLEKENKIVSHQTGNNSGVIHSGIYYKPGSLKALNCITGYSALLKFCQEENIPYEICGKLIVATRAEELPGLESLFQRGLQNGLTEIRKINGDEVKDFEPYAYGIGGIWVPYTGIIDYKEVGAKYAEIFVNRYQGEIFLEQKVIDINIKNMSCEVITPEKTFKTRLVVNTAGLYSDQIAQLTRKIDVRIIPFRGEYFEIKKEKQYLVKNLLYPIPDPAFPFLGVHFTRRIHGGLEAGPNAVFAFKKEGYKKTDFNFRETFDSFAWPGFQKILFKYWKTGLGEYRRSFNKTAFTKSLQRILPQIEKEDLTTGGAGVRAQACTRDGLLIDDFLILEDQHIINILNAPSPAATASLAIGKAISGMALNRF